ncbi:hypothetical protein CO038_00495 [Candidatus Pacearchaeota archaeon CG_4_9_14_0_2_um_filter_39_13]|nr:hypothetical protein [Candidatus Pacearchaeota archaeon]OIO42967.1 MAG: hypothetical protein AUJ64_03280 [Candidatus Pacearchaeota archaeon CG1_02_39_14]PJC45035.1 MAG: hypothetical protein CO038_00495 [Candidatus Pacearchaeota archaeon CG_4_9_14_0_2_um_filter_39_13]
MVVELKKSIDAGKVFFGIRQSLKNSGRLKRTYIPSDAREETIEMLKKNKIEFDVLEVSKEEAAQKLELDFLCEVFGMRK